MTISEKNIVARWELMANANLGILVQPLAKEFAKLFKIVFESEFKMQQFEIKGFENILPTLRGFAINCGDYAHMSVAETLGLDIITTDKESVKELDYYLMNELNWFSRYEYAQTL